jgi:hypothetical protein
MNGAMHYRFALVDFRRGANEVVGEWDTSLQTAFTRIHPLIADNQLSTLSKISKEVMLGVHTDRVQTGLSAAWQALQATMSVEERRLAVQYEQNPSRYELRANAAASSSSSSKRAKVSHGAAAGKAVLTLEVERPRNPFGILTVLELATVFNMVENSAVGVPVVQEALAYLDAGLGANAAYVFDFLEIAEMACKEVWASTRGGASMRLVQCRLLGSSSLDPHVWLLCQGIDSFERCTLQFRAAVFVFARMSLAYPTQTALHAAVRGDHTAFQRSITQLPSAEKSRECFGRVFGTE